MTAVFFTPAPPFGDVRPAAAVLASAAAWIGAAALGVAVTIALVFLLLAWRNRGDSHCVLIGFLRVLNRIYCRVLHGVRRAPDDPMPPSGAAIVVANHRSGVDPCVIAVHTLRLIHFLMAQEYFCMRGLRWFFRIVGAIPVRRDGNDLAATKRALRVLGDGEVIGIFPEGGIRNRDPDRPFSGDGGSEAMKHGAALLALRSGAPIVPVWVTGTPPCDSVFRALVSPSRSRVVFGEPIRLPAPAGRRPSREELEDASARIVEGILALRHPHEADRKPAPAVPAD